MNFSVMLEHVEENGYRVTTLAPTLLVAEAPSRDEAIEKIRALISERLSGAELIQVEVPLSDAQNPWLAIAGTWRDHPDVDDVSRTIEAYRRETDADPNRL